MERDLGSRAGARAQRLRPRLRLRAVAGFAGHVAVVACWLLVAVMAAITWGPHVTSYRTDIIVGQSMEPTIPLYSVIVVEPVDPETLRVGDVITFEQPDIPGRKVTHRIVQVADGPAHRPAFTTKGDNNLARDPYEVVYEGRGWRVREHVPHIGWLMLQAQTPWARVLLVALPVLVLLVQFLRWLWRDQVEHASTGHEDTPGGFLRDADQTVQDTA